VSALLLAGVEVEGALVDVRCLDGRVAALAEHLAPDSGEERMDGGGGALLPGLHDHHVHLLATAAARRSVLVGPPAVTSPSELAAALRPAGPGWVRAVGYHESVAGDLDRAHLDALVPDRPLRVQHRSGALWVLNSAGCRAIGVLDGSPGFMELDHRGEVTGRLYRHDDWLRQRLPAEAPPDLAGLGRELAGYGVTGVTDATPFEDVETLHLLAAAGLPQRVQVMGGPGLAGTPFGPGLVAGPVKLLITDHALPSLDQVVRWLRRAHAAGRPAAVHCVTRVALVLALTAWQEAGARPGDRIEHGAVVPLELLPRLVELGLTVVTQPHFIAERGDEYRQSVPLEDRPDLYRCRSLRTAGIPVAGGTDAPYGHPDPWRAVRAAVERTTASGHALGPGERLPPAEALDLFLSPLEHPGGPARRVTVGAAADLVLLHQPLRTALAEPSAEQVRLTLVGGAVAASAG
jgi:predicted amidohydrolase YtcJ